MPCYSPMVAYATSTGSVVFVERNTHDIHHELLLPCGQCIGCRLERSRQWATRCMHEASLYKQNAFITLTYDPAHLPARGQLVYPDFQKFMKRLRKHFNRRIRFYMCGEYGDLDWRPHYHACLFNIDFPDKVLLSRLPSGADIYRSAILEALWPYGICSTGEVTFESAGYVARYCVQKRTGQAAKLHYRRQDSAGVYDLLPEFNHSSLKPGIGAGFLAKWQSDIYPSDHVVINGHCTKPPRYYDALYKRADPLSFEAVSFEREQSGRAQWRDNTPRRLSDKAVVQAARAAFLKRGFNAI